MLAISAISVIFMCPLMSLAATLLFKDAGKEVIAVWLETTAMNFPMALCWQLFFAGPMVRFVSDLFSENVEQKSGAVSCGCGIRFLRVDFSLLVYFTLKIKT